MDMDMDIPITITATNMDIPNAVTGITAIMPTTGILDISIIVGLEAIATRVISADKSAITIARL
jgi:hypothetical protein